MKEFTFEVNWMMAGTMTVTAKTLQEALAHAYNSAPLPEDADYLSGSFRVSSLYGDEIFPENEPDVLVEFEQELTENEMIKEVEPT